MRSGPLVVVAVLALTALLLEAGRGIVFLTSSRELFWLFALASVMVSLMAIAIRAMALDVKRVVSVLDGTDQLDGSARRLEPRRFLDLMPLAMVVCTVADVALHYSFVAGMLVFLLAHMVHVRAFSGVVHLRPSAILSGELRGPSIVSIAALSSLGSLAYLLLLYDPGNEATLMIIPYLVVLASMVAVSWIGLWYARRPLHFRAALALGATLFMVSDTLIAFNEFVGQLPVATLLTRGLYLVSVLLLQTAVLSLRR